MKGAVIVHQLVSQSVVSVAFRWLLIGVVAWLSSRIWVSASRLAFVRHQWSRPSQSCSRLLGESSQTCCVVSGKKWLFAFKNSSSIYKSSYSAWSSYPVSSKPVDFERLLHYPFYLVFGFVFHFAFDFRMLSVHEARHSALSGFSICRSGLCTYKSGIPTFGFTEGSVMWFLVCLSLKVFHSQHHGLSDGVLLACDRACHNRSTSL